MKRFPPAMAERLREQHLDRNRPVIDFLLRAMERDREAFASVLGSAIALRLFLFIVPAITAILGLVKLFGASAAVTAALETSRTAGRVALDIQTASTQSSSSGLALAVSGVGLTLWAGRTLTSVLAASAAGAWRLSADEARPTLRMAGTLTGLIFSLVLATTVLNRVRSIGGIALTTGSLVVLAALVAAGWFIVMWTLPSATQDPGAHLPGAAFFGISVAGLQWFTQFYLPESISRSSETMGTIGVAVATLGYFFLVGRLMATSFVVSAVTWERLGSVSQLVFGLPGLRRLPHRYPKLVEFFGLGEDSPRPPDGSDGTDGTDGSEKG